MMKRPLAATLLLAALLFSAAHSLAQTTARQPRSQAAPRLVARRVTLASGKSFDLNLPEGFAVSIAAQGLRRVRFMAESPDGRVFVTDMHSLADNKRGAVYVLDQFDPATKSFKKVTPYLTGLRNPNSVAFYRDRGGADWLYLALTDRLVRYRFTAGEEAPTSKPEVLATFPDYGLNYKYGGWHLTRTVAVGGDGKIYVAVGSSCNACEEKEDVRASVVVMDADGKNQRRFARGLRNAVGLRFAGGRLFATNMGADHLGDHRPADTMYALRDGADYGWPYCYQSGPRVLRDPQFNPRGAKLDCRKVPAALAAFDSHSSPLGLEYFGGDAGELLSDSFLVALHGSTKKSLGHGYRVARVGAAGTGAAPEDFITGFIQSGRVNGRPADVLSLGGGAFLLTDDHAGVVYYVHREGRRQ